MGIRDAPQPHSWRPAGPGRKMTNVVARHLPTGLSPGSFMGPPWCDNNTGPPLACHDRTPSELAE